MSDIAKGNVVTAGNVEADNYNIKFGIVIEFKNADECMKALREGMCEFTIFGAENPPTEKK